MISCTEFIPSYSELFTYLEAEHGRDEVDRFWNYLFQPDGKGIPLVGFIEREGIKGCWSYWKGTLNEEAADFTMYLNEKRGFYHNVMHHCPSKGRLLELKEEIGIEPYHDYCLHCDLYRLAAEKCGKVLARDLSEKKVDLIVENIERMGLQDKVVAQTWDATVADETKAEYADVVFMDVPCSGLGVMGKKRDIKYHVTPETLESLVELQKQIVESSWQYVKKGGVLMYSTCTIHKEENQDMSRFICENYPFELEEEKQILPGFTEADGFYYARLRRKTD